MILASAYSLYKNYETLNYDNLLILALGFSAAFFSALLSIKVFLNFISRFNFIPFGIYRILLGFFFLYHLEVIG